MNLFSIYKFILKYIPNKKASGLEAFSNERNDAVKASMKTIENKVKCLGNSTSIFFYKYTTFFRIL